MKKWLPQNFLTVKTVSYKKYKVQTLSQLNKCVPLLLVIMLYNNNIKSVILISHDTELLVNRKRIEVNGKLILCVTVAENMRTLFNEMCC